MKRAPFSLAMTGLALVFGVTFFFLQLTTVKAYLSPDETAIAASAEQFARSGTFRIPNALLKDFSFVHPRSFIAQGDAMVPVGFLGMPLLIAGLIKLFGETMPNFFTPLLALSAAIPLWGITRTWGRWAQAATIISWLTFPTVILYANRGLFPNLPVICLALWSSWLIFIAKKKTGFIFAGLLAGLALLIRPVEITWIFPWIGMACWARKSHGGSLKALDLIAFVSPLLIVCIAGLILGKMTYGTWFISGYQIHDPVVIAANGSSAVSNPVSWTWPFGIHPRNVWWNARTFILQYFAPWTIAVISATVIGWRKKKYRPWMVVAAWTLIVLVLVYGEAMYQDNIQMNQATLANSFLRYLLPYAVVVSVSIGLCVKSLTETWRVTGRIISTQALLLLVLFGMWTAFSRDSEGLAQDRRELTRYIMIRETATHVLEPDTIVLSDRSDKIFFPQFSSVSPLPEIAEIAHVNKTLPNPVAVFIRTSDDAALESWRANGLELIPILDAGNESLYMVE